MVLLIETEEFCGFFGFFGQKMDKFYKSSIAKEVYERGKRARKELYSEKNNMRMAINKPKYLHDSSVTHIFHRRFLFRLLNFWSLYDIDRFC